MYYFMLVLLNLLIKYRYFGKQFKLAETFQLPMFLHMRAAAGDFCDILAQNKNR